MIFCTARHLTSDCQHRGPIMRKVLIWNAILLNHISLAMISPRFTHWGWAVGDASWHYTTSPTLAHDLLPVASFTKEVNPWLAKRPLVFNGRLANCGLTSLVKEATGSAKPLAVQWTSVPSPQPCPCHICPWPASTRAWRHAAGWYGHTSSGWNDASTQTCCSHWNHRNRWTIKK